MRIAVFVLMLICAMSLSAQQEVLLRSGYQPGKVYVNTTLMTMKGELHLDGDEDIMEDLAESGMVLPIKLNGLNDLELTIRTSARGVDGMMPATMTYDRMKVSMQMMGKSQEADSPLRGVVISGKYDSEDRFTVESAPGLGEGLSQEDLSNAINQVQQSMKFPGRPMKAGDTFTQRVPMDIPVATMSALSIYTESVYTVSRINAGMVVMDITVSLTMDAGPEAMSATAVGKGAGTCTYDIAETIITSYDLDLDYTVSMQVQGIMTMTLQMTSNTKQATQIR